MAQNKMQTQEKIPKEKREAQPIEYFPSFLCSYRATLKTNSVLFLPPTTMASFFLRRKIISLGGFRSLLGNEEPFCPYFQLKFALLVSASEKIRPYSSCNGSQFGFTDIRTNSVKFTNSTRTPNFGARSRYFSTNSNNNGKDQSSSSFWKSFGESEGKFDSFFTEETGNLEGINNVDEETKSPAKEDQWWLKEKGPDNQDEDDIFRETEEKGGSFGNNPWMGMRTEDLKPWNLGEEEKSEVFDFPEVVSDVIEPRAESSSVGGEGSEDAKKLVMEEQALTAVLKGPKRAFGDLIAASGITDEMLDSLIALKDFEGVEGLPPLTVIEDMRYEKSTRKSTRAEIERQKQEELAKTRVRQVDDKGRAYGTGRRKCSVARVWVQPGNGRFIVNDKEFDVYFPMLDHRSALLRPFSETKTLGLWDVNCTVKGGGVSGQVGAIRLGISRALQNWEPDLRPTLRSAGFLTRDPRVVERKKPGKAKARKSFQWVKR